jgi:hypothetical protein
LRRLANVWVGLILVQVALGAWTIWSNKAADVATAHVVVGALSLVTGALGCLISFRRLTGPSPGPRRLINEDAEWLIAFPIDSLMSSTAPRMLPPPAKGWVAVYADLVKARLTLLVLITTAGWILCRAYPWGRWIIALMFHALFGTALVASGAAALNQLLEREYDARMRRTAGRPLPSGGCNR